MIRTGDIIGMHNYMTYGVIDGRRCTEARLGAIWVFGSVVFTDSDRGSGIETFNEYFIGSEIYKAFPRNITLIVCRFQHHFLTHNLYPSALANPQ